MKIKRIIKSLLPDPLKNAYYVGVWNEEDLHLPIKERYAKVRWIKVGRYAKDGWFADPFFLTVTEEEIVLLVEEMIYYTGKGILAKLVIDRKDMTIKSKKTILELDTHLSYPIYFCENDKIYIYPENQESGSVKIYEYDEKKETSVYVKDIINEPLVDTQIVKIDGVYYAFGVKMVSGLQSDTKTLLIYKSDKLLGDYKYFQTIDNDKCEERGAGFIHIDGQGRLIRPAQCCEGGYGKAVVLYQLQLKDGLFTETEIDRIEPDESAPYGSVLHTFNNMNGLYVVDGFKWIYPRAKKVYCKLRGLKY